MIPKSILSKKNDEQAREINRDKGISYVAGVYIEFTNLLRDFHIENKDPVDMADKIEMVTPLMRPYGCGPVAPDSWVVLRTYQRIVEVRDEIRMDDSGLAIGDRTFKRSYQLAQAEARRLRGTTDLAERALTIEPAFRYISDKLWHRYLFPFGTFTYRMPSNVGKLENNWKKYMLDTPRDSTPGCFLAEGGGRSGLKSLLAGTTELFLRVVQEDSWTPT